MDYQELARMRHERTQREIAYRVEDIKRDYADVVQQRDAYDPNTERESWDFYDRQAQELESNFLQLQPPEQPRADPRMLDFVQRNKSFFDKHGARAYQAADAAHQYITRARDPHATNPLHTGMGLDTSSPEYFEHMKICSGCTEKIFSALTSILGQSFQQVRKPRGLAVYQTKRGIEACRR